MAILYLLLIISYVRHDVTTDCEKLLKDGYRLLFRGLLCMSFFVEIGQLLQKISYRQRQISKTHIFVFKEVNGPNY
jgi:hypothetical protein